MIKKPRRPNWIRIAGQNAVAGDYPSVIASDGQTDAQLPQLMHVSGSM